ncbi:MAG: pirin family protein [Deltaproteobacteria bacterium]|nr:pirin family protein [Deltaproteobacteria bacterium]
MHHDDAYPAGGPTMGPPPESLRGRAMGRDFDVANGWRMYHGEVVPGFPQHPHRGFETVTVVRKGLLDHSDSLGAAARYGNGDVQWLTTGRGVLHAEMFPLLNADAPNPLDLFQIWLNLPAADKMVEPHFKMLWAEEIPTVQTGGVAVSVIAGRFGDVSAPSPAPKSWAARADADVAIWTLEMAPRARLSLPPARPGSNRVLYFHAGDQLVVAGERVDVGHAIQVRGDVAIELDNGAAPASLLVLQGRPIGEKVAQQGPFVMNTRAEIEQAFADYQRTRFGGWPWPSNDPVHARDSGRFARHADGTVEKRT